MRGCVDRMTSIVCRRCGRILLKKNIRILQRNIGIVKQAVLPLGAYGNYANAPYLFMALMLQARASGSASLPVIDLISFYTRFATLRSPVQTWNEAFLECARYVCRK